MSMNTDSTNNLGALAFHCPTTGENLDAGIGTEPYTFGTMKTLPITVSCPHCGGSHEFRIEDGHLGEAA